MGDIIRVHRAYVNEYKGLKQFTCNIFFNSSWALFSPYSAKDRVKKEDIQSEEAKDLTKADPAKLNPADARDFHPFAYFGKSFSFEKAEQRTITSYRDWVAKSFAKHRVLSERYITKLSDVPVEGAKRDTGRYYDFDLQVKITQLFKLDDYSSEIRVIDSSN